MTLYDDDKGSFCWLIRCQRHTTPGHDPRLAVSPVFFIITGLGLEFSALKSLKGMREEGEFNPQMDRELRHFQILYNFDITEPDEGKFTIFEVPLVICISQK